MKQTRHHLAELIGERTMHISSTKELAKEVASFLLHENKAHEIDTLMRDVLLYRAEHGIVEATAVSAHQLTPQIKSEIESLLKREYKGAKQVILHEQLDPKVIGGVRIDMAGEQLDLTLKTKLNRFKRLAGSEKGLA